MAFDRAAGGCEVADGRKAGIALNGGRMRLYQPRFVIENDLFEHLVVPFCGRIPTLRFCPKIRDTLCQNPATKPPRNSGGFP